MAVLVTPDASPARSGRITAWVAMSVSELATPRTAPPTVATATYKVKEEVRARHARTSAPPHRQPAISRTADRGGARPASGPASAMASAGARNAVPARTTERSHWPWSVSGTTNRNITVVVLAAAPARVSATYGPLRKRPSSTSGWAAARSRRTNRTSRATVTATPASAAGHGQRGPRSMTTQSAASAAVAPARPLQSTLRGALVS
ncbi:hypothetical protein APS67_005312 [Streptomyces sp. AVP053U2]|nr:hypothetical protein APS67_005312 [Streptomyces sp. AVP053U2]